jgi:hypothetical protein
MDLDVLLSLIFRFGLIFVYLGMAIYFNTAYKKTKQEGFVNNFFRSFAIFFFILMVFHVIYATYELYFRIIPNPIDLKLRFPWYVSQSNLLDEIGYQVRPLYLFFYSLLNYVIAALVYPLEQAMQWKRNFFTKLNILCGTLLWTLWIPALSYTYYTFIPIIMNFVGIGLGFILYIGVNIKLFKQSTGAIRTQSLYAIFAFFFLAFGLYVALEVGFFGWFGLDLSYRWEVVFGSAVQLISVVFYRLGFARAHA